MTTPTRETEPRLSVTRVWARNFKSIRELDLELGPLTVLVGPNASGKSNTLDILCFISHALRRDLDSAVTARGGIVAIRRSGFKGNVEVGFRAEKGGFRIDYGFVLGSRSGIYYIKREYGAVTPADRNEEPVEFEVMNGRLLKPRELTEERLETTEIALPMLRRVLFRVARSGDNPIGRATQTYHDVSEVVRSISDIKLYRLFPDEMRRPQIPRDRAQLNEKGSNLASVLRDMMKRKAPYLGEIKSALGHVVPGLSDLRIKQVGGFLVVKLRHNVAGGRSRTTFYLSQESDGTVRLLGLLTALYQDNPPLLMGIEEPDLTIHPGALSVLAEIMEEATLRAQVLVTTHSPDLIDHLPIDSLRAVSVKDGCTVVGPVSETQAEAVRDGLFTSGELHSMEGLEPSA